VRSQILLYRRHHLGLLGGDTVRNYLSNAIAKTGTGNRSEAVRIAEERGWL